MIGHISIIVLPKMVGHFTNLIISVFELSTSTLVNTLVKVGRRDYIIYGIEEFTSHTLVQDTGNS